MKGRRGSDKEKAGAAPTVKVVAENRKARHDYHVEETYEAGIALTGSEVKSLRSGRASIVDGYAKIEGGEVFLHDVHISSYDKAGYFGHDPLRKRKLLLHKAEIMRLLGKTQQRGYTLVPLELYFNERGIAKVKLGLAKGKRQYDRRDEIAQREAERRMRAAKSNRRK